MREIPFSAIQLPIYEAMKNFSKRIWEIEESEFNFFHFAFNGSSAGMIASFITTPVDVVKTKMMTNRSDKAYSFKKAVSDIHKSDGLGGFMKAWHVRTLSLGIASIIYFSAYEFGKRHIGAVLDKK